MTGVVAALLHLRCTWGCVLGANVECVCVKTIGRVSRAMSGVRDAAAAQTHFIVRVSRSGIM